MKNNRTFNSLPTYGQIESGLFHKTAVIKSVCPKCKSDDWDSIGKNCRCNKCNKRWKQTVL
jgi:tRNA(Ile2) C34 agmatinyltransferase TiaS